jgi:cation diffusion facilitator CzcD-associated flavoprotein CzcO
MHSAHWDQEYDFNDKKVAVIGIGSSAIQILPQLATSKLVSPTFALTAKSYM